MSDEATRALDAAATLGLSVEVTPVPRVRSLQEAATALGLAPRQIVKTLVVRVAEGDYRLVLVPGDRQISWPKLRAVLGVNRAAMPPAEEALAATGYERGTITPLGAAGSWPVVADTRIEGRINLGSGAHGQGLGVDAAALLTAYDAVVADVTD